MTKLQVRLKLEAKLDETLLEKLGGAQAIYGVEWIRLDPTMTHLLVEYDATRLRPPEVSAALRSLGLPVAFV